ncbi:MAG TPA: DUF5719 family protein [Terriglobia bacterium]|nr:DUF5719 family protein [Terriglobia bacterium]
MKSKFVGLVMFLLLSMPGPISAQGLFEGFGFPRTVTATGHTELLGPIVVSLRQGSTSAGKLVIDVSPLQITNASSADIRVVATGITVGPTEFDPDNKSLVRIPVSAGASAGSIRVEGIRVSVVGTGITSQNAKLSWEGSTALNVFTAGSSVAVINAVQSGLTADPITDRFVVFNGQVFDDTSTISLREGYAAAFSSSREFGQTVSTRVRIRVTDFPTNLQMRFPASVTATNSGATLTTLGGAPVTLPTANGSTEVTYSFSGVSGSDDLVESFNVPFTVALVGPAGSTQPTIELSLAPMGAAVPNGTFASTDIPRYAEDNIVVQEGTSRIVTKVLYWTGINPSLQNQVTLLNPSSRAANLTIDALNASGQAVSGTGITNPATLSLSANQSLVRTLSDLFGTASGISSLRIQSTNADLLVSATVSGNGAAESVPFLSRATATFNVPVVNENAQLYLLNPNSSPSTGVLTLRTAEGRAVATTSVNLAPLASTSIALGSVFNNPSQGYVSASFSNSVVAFESFGNTSTLNLLAIQPPAGVSSLFVPFFAVGNGFQTDINLLNLSDDTVTLTARLFDGTGSPVGANVLITMPAGEQLAIAVDRLFSRVPFTGYIRFDVPQVTRGFFSFFPAISGHARIQSSQDRVTFPEAVRGGSTVVPLSAFPLADAFILGSGTASGEFEGIALVNPTASSVVVTLQAMTPSGSVLATTTLTLNPGQLLARLVSELLPGLSTQSVIRVTSSAPIVTTAVIGSNSLDMLRSLPVLR